MDSIAIPTYMARYTQEHISTHLAVNLSRTARHTCQQQQAVYRESERLEHYTDTQRSCIHMHSSENNRRYISNPELAEGTEWRMCDPLRLVNQTDASDTRNYMQYDANDLKTCQKLSETLKNEPKMPYSPGGSARLQTSDMWKCHGRAERTHARTQRSN